MTRNFWIVLVVIILALGGVWYFTGSKNNNSNSLKPTSHIEGQGQDNITLVEYGDYECPYCGQYYTTVKQVQAMYNTQIFFQFRNFPLTSIHPNAFAGARAAEAAGVMGQFWQMHDLLYEQNQVYYGSNQQQATWVGLSNPLPAFDQYAQSLGLSVSKFNQLYASDQVNNLVTADENEANSLGLDATPTFILDGKQIQVSDALSSFETLINNEIAKKAGQKTTTTPSTGTTTQTKK